MSVADGIVRKFDELENEVKTNLGKVDPRLVIDLLLRQKKGEKNPIYTLEVFIQPKQDTQQIRNRITDETGMVPAFYDQGTHVVVAHKVDFNMLKMINDIDFVERIRGTYVGEGTASIGPTYDI